MLSIFGNTHSPCWWFNIFKIWFLLRFNYWTFCLHNKDTEYFDIGLEQILPLWFGEVFHLESIHQNVFEFIPEIYRA